MVNVYVPSFIVTAELLWTESSAEFIVNVPPFIYSLPSALIPFVLAESESEVSLSDCSVPAAWFVLLSGFSGGVSLSELLSVLLFSESSPGPPCGGFPLDASSLGFSGGVAMSELLLSELLLSDPLFSELLFPGSPCGASPLGFS